MSKLTELHTDIDARVQAIRASHPDWLCRMGCDGCCHRLAGIPSLTEAEWGLLQTGLAALSPESIEEISQNMTELARHPSRPVVCPYWIVQLGLVGFMSIAR